MNAQNLPPWFLDLLKSVTAKRPRTVIDHILEHGQVTSEELRTIYGYNHPPRAVRDVRELGIPIVTSRVEGPDGRKIAAYSFGNLQTTRISQVAGRGVLSSALKEALIGKCGSRCNIYLEDMPADDLQIDHRIPYEIGGDIGIGSDDLEAYMLLCASANRAKSWSCERCDNWQIKSVETCKICYWAYPETYSHVAMRDIRRVDIIWQASEAADYDRAKTEAARVGEEMPEFVRRVLRSHLEKDR